MTAESERKKSRKWERETSEEEIKEPETEREKAGEAGSSVTEQSACILRKSCARSLLKRGIHPGYITNPDLKWQRHWVRMTGADVLCTNICAWRGFRHMLCTHNVTGSKLQWRRINSFYPLHLFTQTRIFIKSTFWGQECKSFFLFLCFSMGGAI